VIFTTDEHVSGRARLTGDEIRECCEGSRALFIFVSIFTMNKVDHCQTLLVRSLVNVASVMLVQLPGTLYLPASSSLLTPIDSKSFSPVSHSILTFVSAPGQFVSRALQIPIYFCICSCIDGANTEHLMKQLRILGISVTDKQTYRLKTIIATIYGASQSR